MSAYIASSQQSPSLMTPATPSSIEFQVTINGQVIPIYGFEAVAGSYGSVGSATISTDISNLLAAGIDIFDITTSQPSMVPVEILVAGSSFGSAWVKIFSGEFLDSSWAFDSDSVQIHARDWASLLVDQKRVPATVTKLGAEMLTPGQLSGQFGINVQNQTLEELVGQIATQFGFTPVFYLSGNNPQVGVQFGSTDSTWAPTSQSLWSMLNKLASDVGYVVYTTPKKELVFGIPGGGLKTLPMQYGVNVLTASSNGTSIPTKGLEVKHNPRMNSTFSVLVLSHNGSKAELVRGSTTVIGPNVHGFTPGIYDGASAITQRSNIVAAKISIPLYTFRYEGLTQAQTQTKAHAVALDISRRNAIATWLIDGYPFVTPTQPVKFDATSSAEPGFMQMDWSVTAIRHLFTMPTSAQHQAMGGSKTGYYTELKAWNLVGESLSQQGGSGMGAVD